MPELKEYFADRTAAAGAHSSFVTRRCCKFLEEERENDQSALRFNKSSNPNLRESSCINRLHTESGLRVISQSEEQ